MMQIRVLYDKDTDSGKLYTGMGLSMLIADTILFDTGTDGGQLLANMKTLGVDTAGIEAVVISHDHWDHTGGLWDILSVRKGLKVYGCPQFSRGFKQRVKGSGSELIESERPIKIAEEIFVSGQIMGKYKGMQMPEQALILRSPNGISVITGCAHPGIVKMLEEAQKAFPGEDFYLVCGGFHLMPMTKKEIDSIINRFKELGVKRCGPTHCTGEEAIRMFRGAYEKDFIEVKVGQILKI